MIQTLEALIDEHGVVLLFDAIHLPTARLSLVTVLEDAPAGDQTESALLSEAVLAEDWNRPEEDAAWAHLQPAK